MRIRSLGTVLLAFIFAVVTATTTVADESSPAAAVPTTITGRFVDENNWPLAKIGVSNWDYDWNYRETTTDKNGNFVLTVSVAEVGSVELTYSDQEFGQFEEVTLTLPQVTPGKTRSIGTIRLSSVRNPGRHKKAIKTSSKKAVKKAYRKRFAKQVRNEKPVKVKGCKAAATPKALQKRELKAVNLFRAMAGLAPVKLDKKLSQRARAAALIQYRQGYLDHYPAKSTKCYTKAGGAASSESNLSMGWVGAGNMNGYMIDPGSGNTAVGHRRWIMAPGLTKIGTGYAGTFNALHVTSDPNYAKPTPQWISWPTAGFFPDQLEPWGRWSFMTARHDLSFKKANVTVTIKGKKQKIKVYRGADGYGYQQGLSWDFNKIPKAKGKKTTVVKVAVSGIQLRDATTLPTVTYSVKLFRG
ncbi:Cysteine-rich secretory protein family protein [Micrococcales bacterium KH10]|nr:Cysteine-rich secretory protein family protein [Micrococcales bacterium KH10]